MENVLPQSTISITYASWRSSHMTAKPKVYVTRRIPASGLDVILSKCDAEVWPGDLPPSYETIKQKIAGCDGLVALLTDRIDPALLDSAPHLKVVSNYAVGFN